MGLASLGMINSDILMVWDSSAPLSIWLQGDEVRCFPSENPVGKSLERELSQPLQTHQHSAETTEWGQHSGALGVFCS